MIFFPATEAPISKIQLDVGGIKKLRYHHECLIILNELKFSFFFWSTSVLAAHF
jgi:hypothetical protein